MKDILMKCGHVANAIDENGNPCCAICLPKKEAMEIKEENPSLEGRKAKCSDCGNIVDSSYDLSFFEYKPNEEYDSFYDGCCGWD